MIDRISVVAAIGLSLLASSASAEDNYPTHPVRVIAASAAGGNPDVLARILSARLSEIFINPFVVEDVPGVGGVIAAKQTAAARPDGYTLGLNDSGSLGISIAMNPDANYTLKDFTPITALARLPTILVIKPDIPANTLAEFVALAKSKPGAMSFGSGGTGLVNALLTGEVDAGWSGIPNVVSLIKTSKLRGLCISVLQRDESLPEVPTCDELGYKGFDVATVLGLQSSAGVAPEVVAKLQSAVAKVLREPEIAARLKTLGIHLAENGTAAYTKFMQDELERYTKVVDEFHLRITQ